MASIILYSVCAIIAITTAVSGQEGGTCRACNCQFNNVEGLSRLIESQIASGKLATIIINYNSIQIVGIHIQCTSRVTIPLQYVT